MTWQMTLDKDGAEVWTRGDGVVVRRNDRSVFVAFDKEGNPVLHKGKPRNWQQNARLAKYQVDSLILEEAEA